MTERSVGRFVLESVEGVVLALLVVPLWPVIRRWTENWGSSRGERARAWPGDALVPECRRTYTRAIDVDAPPSALWPWVVQFGLGRAGFYSYELLERLVGIPVKNVERILAQHQTLAVGDEIKLHPSAPGIPVGLLAEETHLCFGRPPGAPASDAPPDPDRSWSVYLEPGADGGSRLVLRSCIAALRKPTVRKRLGLALDGPIDFVMEQRMLRSLKRLAERA